MEPFFDAGIPLAVVDVQRRYLAGGGATNQSCRAHANYSERQCCVACATSANGECATMVIVYIHIIFLPGALKNLEGGLFQYV